MVVQSHDEALGIRAQFRIEDMLNVNGNVVRLTFVVNWLFSGKFKKLNSRKQESTYIVHFFENLETIDVCVLHVN